MRIYLKPLEISDYDRWFTGYAARLPKQNTYDEGYLDMSPCSQEWFANLVAHHQQLAQEDRQYIYGIFHLETGRHLGMIYAATLVRDRTSWAEIGYNIHNYEWRKGYGLEAIRLLLELNRNQLDYHRLEAQISPDNLPSQALIQKAGFDFEMRRKKLRYENGEWQDQDIFIYLEESIRLEE